MCTVSTTRSFSNKFTESFIVMHYANVEQFGFMLSLQLLLIWNNATHLIIQKNKNKIELNE